MTKIIIELETCSKCPHFECTGAYTADSWERPENWWCQHPDVLNSELGEVHKKIAGYVEWTDKIAIPDWCPIAVKEKEEPIYCSSWGKPFPDDFTATDNNE